VHVPAVTRRKQTSQKRRLPPEVQVDNGICWSPGFDNLSQRGCRFGLLKLVRSFSAFAFFPRKLYEMGRTLVRRLLKERALSVFNPGWTAPMGAVSGRPLVRGLCTVGRVVDLRSDTVTQPCADMRAAMARAAVGDDVYGEDPTVAELQAQVAALLGKEDAVLLPSGTMANLACILTHTTRGDQVLLGRQSHIHNWEQGNVSSLASCVMTPLDTNPDGTFTMSDLHAAVSADDQHMPRTRLVCLENSHGGHSGTAVPASFADAAGVLCAEHELVLHIDGARILNAAVALRVAPAELSRAAATVTLCLSKGLGAPVGSMATGTAAHMHSVRRWRKALGGGMRQAGELCFFGKLSVARRRRAFLGARRRGPLSCCAPYVLEHWPYGQPSLNNMPLAIHSLLHVLLACV